MVSAYSLGWGVAGGVAGGGGGWGGGRRVRGGSWVGWTRPAGERVGGCPRRAPGWRGGGVAAPAARPPPAPTRAAPVMMPMQMTSVEPLPMPPAVMVLAQCCTMKVPAMSAAVVCGTNHAGSSACGSSSRARQKAWRRWKEGGGRAAERGGHHGRGGGDVGDLAPAHARRGTLHLARPCAAAPRAPPAHQPQRQHQRGVVDDAVDLGLALGGPGWGLSARGERPLRRLGARSAPA
jgi:hypothetical protein